MKRLRTFLHRASYAAAWVVVGIVIACAVLDRSGWIGDSLRGRITRALPGLDVQIGEARVLWFRPGIVLEEVTVGAGDGFLAFDSVEVRLAPATGWAGLVREIEIHGGRARITDELTRAIQGALSARGRQELPSGPVESTSAIPTVTLTDFRVDLVFPGEAAVPIGLVDLKLEGSGDEKRLSGRLLPHLAGASPDAAVHLSGDLVGERLEVRASAKRLPLDTARLPRPLLPSSPVLRHGAALLTLAFEGDLDLENAVRPRLEGRLALDEGLVELSVSRDPIRDVAARVDLAWAPDAEDGLWTKRAWRGLARLEADWAGTDVDVQARIGNSAGPDLLQVWASLPELPLDAERRADLSIAPGVDAVVDALGLSGTASASLGCRISTLRPGSGVPVGPEFLLDVRPRADAGVRYDGFVDQTGERWGIPIPATDIGGRVVFAVPAGRGRPSRLGLVELSGKLPSGDAYYEGVVWSPPPEAGPGAHAEFQMELWVPSIAIDSDLQAGLAGMPATRSIWQHYGPAGEGELSSRWRFTSGLETNGMTAWGQVDFRTETLRWEPLPVPVHDVSGTLGLRWADRPVEVLDPARPDRKWRPFGLRVAAVGDLATGGRVDALVEFRNETPATEVIPVSEIPVSGIHVERIRVDGMALRGDDFDAVAATFPAVGDVGAQLGIRGRADVRFDGVSPAPGAPYRFDVGIVPAEVELTPAHFPLPFRDLRGRTIVTGVIPFHGEEETPTEPVLSLRGAIDAAAAQGIGTVGVPRLEPGGPLRLSVSCAGVEPGNRAVLGAFETAIGIEHEEGLQPETASLTGACDGVLELEVPRSSEGPPKVFARVELRGNSLTAGSFRLDDMLGTAVFEGSVLRGDRIRARLAESPVELVDFRLVSRDHVDDLESPDRLLAEPDFLGEEAGLVVQSGLRAQDFALTEANLSLFFDPETVESLIGRAQLRGHIDFEDTRIVIVPDDRGGLKLGMHGGLVPHNADVRAGLPIQVSSGRVEIEDLRIESGRTRAWARVSDLFGRIAGRQIQRVAMIVTLMESRLTVDELSGDLEGGSLASLSGPRASPALAVDLRPPHVFTAALEFGRGRRVDANGLLRGLFESSISDKGKVSGWLRVSGRPDDVLGMRGMAKVEFREAQLWSIPVVRALFGRLGFDSTAQFDQMEARLFLENGVLHMTGMDVRSPILHLVGQGSIDFDGRLHHDLEVKYALINLLGPLKVLLYWIQNSILRVAIRGTMWRPEIVLRNGIRDFFRGAPEDHPSLPLPPFSATPSRF